MFDRTEWRHENFRSGPPNTENTPIRNYAVGKISIIIVLRTLISRPLSRSTYYYCAVLKSICRSPLAKSCLKYLDLVLQ